MKLSHQTIELKPTHPFVIARGGYAHHRNVIVRLTDDDGLEGFGEAAPNRYYGESVATVVAALGQFTPILERADPMALESTEAATRQPRAPSAPLFTISWGSDSAFQCTGSGDSMPRMPRSPASRSRSQKVMSWSDGLQRRASIPSSR